LSLTNKISQIVIRKTCQTIVIFDSCDNS